MIDFAKEAARVKVTRLPPPVPPLTVEEARALPEVRAYRAATGEERASLRLRALVAIRPRPEAYAAMRAGDWQLAREIEDRFFAEVTA